MPAIITYMKLALQVISDKEGNELNRRVGYIFKFLVLETGKEQNKFLPKNKMSDRLFSAYVMNDVAITVTDVC